MKKNVKITIALLEIVAILTAAVFCFISFPTDSFAYGIMLGGYNIGGLSKKEAKEKLEGKINEYLDKNIVFHFVPSETLNSNNLTENYSKEIKLKELGVSFNIKKSLEEPFSVGKKGNIWQNLKEKILALQGKYQFPLIVEINDDSFEKFFIENFGQFEVLPQNAQIVFNGKTMSFEVQDPKEGLLFPRDKIKEDIKKDAKFLKNNDLYLSLEKITPEISKEEALKTAAEANKLINTGPYILLAEEKEIEISKKTLGSWVSFSPQKNDSQITLSPTLDENLVKDYLIELATKINVSPQNPVLAFENNALKIITPPKIGRILSIEESAKNIQEKVLENLMNNSDNQKETKISLVFKKIEPKITEEKFNEIQVETLIGKGTSNFSGSPKNRVHNINVAAAKFNGMLIAPGEEFSFNRSLGEIGPNQGYLPELVIKNNKTIPEYGGGVCQVSTTMFRAAVYAGLEVTERHPHAYPVKYYNPQGFDATVYSPSPDLKFKNNTDGWILIQTKIEGSNLIFELYGKNDGRQVSVKGPYQYDFQDDGAMKARLEQEVWKDGNLILKKTFLSSYNSPKLYPTEVAE